MCLDNLQVIVEPYAFSWQMGKFQWLGRGVRLGVTANNKCEVVCKGEGGEFLCLAHRLVTFITARPSPSLQCLLFTTAV